MTEGRDEKDFIEFCKDHLAEFNAIPCEFETRDGDVWDMDKCWNVALNNGLTNLIKE